MKEKEPKFEKGRVEQINNPEQFLGWVKEKAEESDDYVEFYRQSQHKYLDSLLEEKNIDAGRFITQTTIRGEALKIAANENLPLKDFVDKLYKEFIEMQKKMRDLKIPSTWGNKKEERLRSELRKEFEENVRKLLESYKLEVGNYRAEEKLRKYNEVLEKMSYSSGELVGKMEELEEKRGINVDNTINYGAANLFAPVSVVIQKMRPKFEYKLLKEDKLSLEERRAEIERLFGR